MRGFVGDTYAEMMDRKIVWVFGFITIIGVLAISASGKMTIDMQFQGASPLGDPSEIILLSVVKGLDFFLWLSVFLTVMATAGLMPSILSKGRAEYYLSKSVSRATVLLSKLFSVFFVYGGLIAICSLLLVLTATVVHSLSFTVLLYPIVVYMILLFIWLTITFFAGIILGSGTMAIMTAVIVWVVQFALQFREGIARFVDSSVTKFITDALYYILPKFSQIPDLGEALALGHPVESWLPLWTSILFACSIVIITIPLFNRRDY